MTNIEVMNYWINSSDKDYDTMKLLLNNEKNTWCLFIGHLVIEKLLKGLYALKNEDNPYTLKSHNLLALAEKCELELNEDQIEKLQTITQFNISGRYDDYKESFEQKCTNEYTAIQVLNIEEVRTWLKGMLVVK